MKVPVLILSVLMPGFLWAQGASSINKDLEVYYKNANDMAMKEKVIQDVLIMKKAPAIPKKAVQLRKEGEDALQKSQFKDAAQFLRKAANWAPWNAVLYTDLAQAQEKTGLYPEAIQSLNLYLLAAPEADDQNQVRDRIKKLDDENGQWMKAQIDHLEVDAVVSSLMTRLGEMGTAAQEEVPFLVKALKNNDIDTRANAALLLQAMGRQAVGAIPALADRLDDRDPRVRANAAFALSKMGPEVLQVLPTLMDSLTDDNADVRLSVSCALGNIGPAASKAVPDLAKALKDKDARVRADAAYALGTIGPAAKNVLPVLESLSNDKDPIVRKNAASAIEKINATTE